MKAMLRHHSDFLAALGLLLLGLALALLSSGCHARVHAPVYDAIHRGTYVYQRVNEGEFVIAAVDDAALKQAFQEIGCGRKYVCRWDRTGELIELEVRTK